MPDGRLRRSNAWTLDGSETSAAPVSPDGCIRLRSNAGGTALEVSYDQAAYVTLSGGSSKWNAITAPDGNLALSHVAYTTAFTWSATSGTASDLFTLQNTTDDTGTGAILAINTPGGSNAKDPLTITAQTNTRVQIRSNGDLLINRAVTSASGPLIDLRKSRNTLATPWNVASGDSLGTIGYTAFCGTGGTGSEVQLGSFSLIADRDLTAADFGANFRWQTKDSTESFGLRTRMWLTTLGYLGIGQNLVVTDVGARLHVIESGTAVVAAIIQTAASSTADALRLNASSTTKVKFTTTSGGAMNSVFGSAALATNATDGFVYLPTCAGTPTGAATAYTGTSPFVLDTTNSKVYFYYSSAWHDLTGSGGGSSDGSGTELQRTNGSGGFVKVTSSSVSGGAITLAATLTLSTSTATLPAAALVSTATLTGSSGGSSQYAHYLALADDSTAALTLADRLNVLGVYTRASAANDYSTATNFKSEMYLTDGSGTQTATWYGFRSTIAAASGSTLTTWVGFHAALPSTGVTNTYGFTAQSGLYNGFGTSAPSATLHASGTVRLDLGSDAALDVHYRNSSNTNLARLAAGSALQVLRVNAGVTALEWATVGTSDGSGTELQRTNGSGGFTKVTSSSASGADVTWGGLQAQTFTSTATASATISPINQTITLSPASASSTVFHLLHQSVVFGTAQTVANVALRYSSNTHSQNSTLSQYRVSDDTFTKDTAGSASSVTRSEWTCSISSGTTSACNGYLSNILASGGTISSSLGFYAFGGQSSGTFTSFTAFRADYSGTIGTKYGFVSMAGFLHGFGTLTPTVVMDIVGGAADEVVKVTGDSINTAITGYAFGTGKAPIFKLVHGRNTAASPQTTESGDTLGSFVFYGQYDSTAGHIAGVATISAIAQAQFTASNAAPADLAFFTRPSSGSGNHQVLLLTSDQRVGVGYDMAHSDVGARLHVLETDTAVVAAIVRTAASSTADCLRLMASSTVKVKFTTNSSGDMNSVFGSAALATNATDGFIFAPTCAGAATGTPSTYTGTAPVVVDTTNFRLYCNFSGSGWKMLQFI